MQYQYQIDYTGDYENAYPDFFGIGDGKEDVEAWFETVEAEGVAFRARVLFGGQEIEEKIFE